MQLSPEILAAQVNYSQWASRKLLKLALTIPDEEATRHIGNSHGSILKTFQHTYYADRAWLGRLEGTTAGYEDAAPGPTLADLDRDWWPLLSRFEEVVTNLDPAGVLHYKNLKGEPFARPHWQVALHIVNHGTYHRGQIAAILRQLGHQPPSTDLIYYYLEQ
jgi:uncharacterized damage-inducible protein DinB